MIYVINGIGGSGKNTITQEVSDYLNQFGIETFEFSKAQFAKDLMKVYFGWNGISKTEKDRKCMSDLTDIATLYNDLPFKALVKDVEEVMNRGVVFAHIRETEDIKRFQDYFGRNDCRAVLVTRFRSDKSLHPDVPLVYTDCYEYVNNYPYNRRLANVNIPICDEIAINSTRNDKIVINSTKNDKNVINSTKNQAKPRLQASKDFIEKEYEYLFCREAS